MANLVDVPSRSRPTELCELSVRMGALAMRPRVSCERHAELGFVAAVWSATRGRCA
jgi:hypothetical protein